MKPNERLKEIENELMKQPLILDYDAKWLINRVKKLTEALESLSTYEFSVYDKTGILVKQHCKDALEEE